MSAPENNAPPAIQPLQRTDPPPGYYEYVNLCQALNDYRELVAKVLLSAGQSFQISGPPPAHLPLLKDAFQRCLEAKAALDRVLHASSGPSHPAPPPPG